VRWMPLGVMLTMLMGVLDNTIVGTSIPAIVRDLGGASRLSWVVSAYILATAASTPIRGKVGDLFNRKAVFRVAIGDFLVG
jgi:MFS family permease